ncbi:MAG: glutamine-hydrolyzing carbamoyl-phosphate synthase small subunit [Crocinitomicaceae bacterium]|jgi:carbamoyl-phosphate synthase small subunit|nr:glutamine-hydrolyzing carbamoyl-phosphate synthase small subunit [Crocinitomicaceae bacterium]MBK6953599.1 glutamine-hydrolyzing carbamoyl-phosphate synthase small subunit [Crocinitomicaceae bacterium]MBK9592660.1 glutamine-hydrolyzing carbamoyl-phosphate synthase small subunit [Crocinitomicaceae bacterium]
MDKIPAVLVLEDGTVFKGQAIGKIGTTSGEIAFNTGMTGYQEVFTDPSYFKQILIMTTAHIGNYGVHASEVESDSMKIAGLVTKKFSPNFSRTSAEGSLQEFMERDAVVGISDIDTRALVRLIRHKGAMNAIISSSELDVEKLKADLQKVPSMDGLELSSFVATKKAYTSGSENAKYRVALIDFGVKKNIVRCLVERNCLVKVFPMNTTLSEIVDFNPDGIMLSNGPGDPAAMPAAVANVGEMVKSGIPIFGICLGHQILALSQGLQTAKMHNGHRGINHPIKNLLTGKGEITSQNHGFMVTKESIAKNPEIEMTHIHLNDETVAGIRIKNKPVFSVQYHPEASAGPHDSRYLFDQFIENMSAVLKDNSSEKLTAKK